MYDCCKAIYAYSAELKLVYVAHSDDNEVCNVDSNEDQKKEREAEALYCVVLSPREGTVRKNCEKVFMV